MPVLGDAAQAAGSRRRGGRPGALGQAAAFSFLPSKNLGCLGDGGAIATSDDAVAEMANILRFHGSRDRATWETSGYNSRLDEVQAAFLRVLRPELDGWSDARVQAAGHYEAAGLGHLAELPSPTEGVARRGTSTLSAQPTSPRSRTHSAALRLATKFTTGLRCTAIRRRPRTRTASSCQ